MIFADRILKNAKELILKNVKTNEIITYEIQDNLDNIEQEGTKLNSDTFEMFRNDILLEAKKQLRPIGSLFFTDREDNPANIFGFGTWERIKGVTIVGVDEEDDDFNLVNSEVGSKTQELRALIGACNNAPTNIGYKPTTAVPGQSYRYSINGNPADITKINHSTEVLQPNGTFPTTVQPSHLSYIWKRIK